MQFSKRSKVSIALSSFTLLALVSMLMVTFISHGAASRAASSAAPPTASYQGKPLSGQQTATAPGLPTKVTKPAHPRSTPLDVDLVNPGDKAAAKFAALRQGLPVASGTATGNWSNGGPI